MIRNRVKPVPSIFRGFNLVRNVVRPPYFDTSADLTRVVLKVVGISPTRSPVHSPRLLCFWRGGEGPFQHERQRKGLRPCMSFLMFLNQLRKVP